MTLTSPPATTLSTGVRSELQRVGAWITDRRRSSFQPLEPWTQPKTEPSGWPLADLLHHNDPDGPRQASDRYEPVNVLDELAEVGLLARHGDRYEPGRWQLTAASGVYAVRDRPIHGPSQVFLSDDGLRLLESVLTHRPTGRVLDAGCGAGLATAAAALSADHVQGIDLVPGCLEATRLSARLSGVGDKVSTQHADLASYQPDEPVDCIIANLPGVPIPPGLRYPVAGNGGPDGLVLTHRLLDQAPAWLTTRSRRSSDPVLVMRLQSPGDPNGPFALHRLHQFARTAKLDISVITDSRIDHRVRDGLTASYASRHNPDLDPQAVAEAVRSHSREIGMTHYYSSSVVAYPADKGALHHLDLAPRDWLNQPPPTAPVAADLVSEITARYYTSLARLPVGFWELGTHHTITAPARRLRELTELLSQGTTGADAVTTLFADELATTPLQALALYTTTNILIETVVARSQENVHD